MSDANEMIDMENLILDDDFLRAYRYTQMEAFQKAGKFSFVCSKYGKDMHGDGIQVYFVNTLGGQNYPIGKRDDAIQWNDARDNGLTDLEDFYGTRVGSSALEAYKAAHQNNLAIISNYEYWEGVRK